jgi:hypothetical protein
MGRNHDKHDYALPEGKGEAERFAFFYRYFIPTVCRRRQRCSHFSTYIPYLWYAG